MLNYKGSTTNFKHDSDCCTFLGMYSVGDGDYQGEYDLYYCSQGGNWPTIIARYDDDGPAYYVGLVFANRNVPIGEGARRAIEWGLLTQEQVDKEVNNQYGG